MFLSFVLSRTALMSPPTPCDNNGKEHSKDRTYLTKLRMTLKCLTYMYNTATLWKREPPFADRTRTSTFDPSLLYIPGRYLVRCIACM